MEGKKGKGTMGTTVAEACKDRQQSFCYVNYI